MRLFQSIKMAFKSIGKNKTRSLLTMLGIIIGIAAITIMVTFVQGVSDAVMDEMSYLGFDVVHVLITNGNKGLSESDIEKIIDLDKVEGVSKICQSELPVIINGQREDVILTLTS